MTKRLRLSATTSSLSEGRCAMSTGVSFLVGDRYMTPMVSDRLAVQVRCHLCPRQGPQRSGMPRARGAPAAYRRRLSVLRVELHDQLLGEDRVDLLTHGQLVDHDLQRARDDLHPGRGGALTEGLASQLEGERLHGLLADRDDVVLLDAVGRDVHAA